MPRPYTQKHLSFSKLKNNQSKRVFFIVACILLAIFIGIFYNLLRSSIRSSAASIVFGNGLVSLDKTYVSGVSETNTVSTLAGGELTIRVKYNNTANQSATGVTITDTLPANTSLVTGSIKNCFSDAACAIIPDSVVSGSNLQIAPLAGLFGYSPTATQSNLELGRYKYIKLQTDAIYNPGFSDTTCNLRADNSSGFGPANFCGGSDHYEDIMNVDIAGNRYLKLQTDSQTTKPSGFADRSCNLRADNNAAFGTSPNCENRDIRLDNMVTDLLGNRYLKLQTDRKSGTPLHEISCNLRSDNDPSFGTPAFCNGRDTRVHSMNVDMWDGSRGNGYIEYKIRIGNTATGLLGTNPTMSGSFGSINSNSVQTIDIINCSTKNPSNWLRNLTLSDAELRTDQDFTCNFVPVICPVVFLDLDNDGVQDPGETNSAGRTIELLRADGTTLVTSVVTNNGGTNCFNQLAGGGTEYKVKNTNPLTAYNTTGTDTVSIVTSSSSSTTYAYFGYSAGSLTLSVPPTTTFQTRNTTTASQTTCAQIDPIRVTESRINNPGWSLTATIENFVAPAQNNTISIANKLTMTPSQVTVESGQNGPLPGNQKTVVSTTDPVLLMEASSGAGLGVYKSDLGLCLQLEPYTPSGNFQTTIVYTII
jgi:uncharacterized repeat protein (TIGR01451 family)